MTRFGTVLLVAGLMLAGCDEGKLGWPTDEPAAKKTAAANCPPPTASACPQVAEAAKVETKQAVATETRRVVRKRKVKVKVHRSYEREASSGLAGGGSYTRYEEREYARVEPSEGRAYRRYEGSTGARRAYQYESSESSSESSRSYSESSSSGYGYGMAEGGAYGEGYGGGFDPRRERYYAAGRDSRGYLVWPGKR